MWNYGKHATYIPEGKKTHYLRDLLSRNIYNLEPISPLFEELPDGEEGGQHCTHHGC